MWEYFRMFYVEMIFGSTMIVTELTFIVCAVLLINDLRFTLKDVLIYLAEIAGGWVFILLMGDLLYLAVKTVDVFLYVVRIAYLIFTGILLIVYFLRGKNKKPLPKTAQAVTFFSAFVLIISLSEAVGYVARETFGISGIDMTLVTVVFLTAAMTIYLKIFSAQAFPFMQKNGTILLIALCVVAYVLEALSLVDWLEVTREYKIFVSISFFVMLVGAYYLFWRMTKEYNENLEAHVMKKRLEDEKEFLRLSKQNLDDLRIVRHEIKNQYAYMKLLIGEKQYDKVNEYFAEIEDTILPPLDFVDCGNNIVNAVMNLETTKAKADNIKIETKICAVPEKLSVKDSELTSLLSNLLDNAIEASVEAEAKSPIGVSISQKDKYLYIKVTNPVTAERGREEILQLKTQKKQPQLHGYGTKIINKIVKKYDGSIHYDLHNGEFIADVMLALGTPGEL